MRTVLAALAGLSAIAAVAAQERRVWTERDRVYPPFYQSYNEATHDAVYMQADAQYIYFSMKARTEANPERWAFTGHTFLYLNTDQDQTTGYTGPAYTPRGFEFIVKPSFSWWPIGMLEGAVDVYGACPMYGSDNCVGTGILFSTSDFTYIRDSSGLGRGLEFNISRAKLEEYVNHPITDIDVAVSLHLKDDAGNKVADVLEPYTFQNYFSFYEQTSQPPACPAPVDQKRCAVLFSTDSRDKFFQDKAYSQLFMSMQYQTMQAGCPTDRVSLDDLINYERLCGTDVLVIPYLAFLKRSDFAAVRKGLFMLIHVYGVSVITSGNFLTNDASGGWGSTLPGDPYFSMGALLGVYQASPVFADTTRNRVFTTADGEPLFGDLGANAQLYDDSILGTFTNMYVKFPSSLYEVKALSKQNFDKLNGAAGQEFNAIVSSELPGTNIFGRTSGRVVHFATLEILANSDLVWRAVRWAILKPGATSMGLMPGRQFGVFTTRVDCDQSQFHDEVEILMPYFIDHWSKPWYDQWGVVASYYINIGNDLSDGAYTDWNKARALWGQLLAIESEVASHSYTHPHNISDPAINLQFEFGDSSDEIKREMNLPRAAAAQPGATEELWVAKRMEAFYSDSYFSGGYSGVRAGYPGCFGFLDDVSDMVYVAPNMMFDFTLLGFQKLTAAEAIAIWEREITYNTNRANHPIIHWPIHDYAAGDWGYGAFDELPPGFNHGPGYTDAMFESVLSRAAALDFEFITTLDLSDRIRALASADLRVTPGATSESLSVQVSSSAGRSLGTLALDVMQGLDSALKIHSVTGHYAYSADRVFLPAAGASFVVQLGLGAAPIADQVTRIVKLPMRAELVAISGDGEGLSATFFGRGKVEILLNPNTAFASFVVSGSTIGASASSVSVVTSSTTKSATVTFDLVGTHTVVVAIA